jgi:hypothetical protein
MHLQIDATQYNVTFLIWFLTAALLDAYAAASGTPTSPEREATLIIHPPPSFIKGMANLQHECDARFLSSHDQGPEDQN